VPIVLAYTGAPDATIAVRWLIDTSRAEVVTVTLDVGQGVELDAVRERAIAAGAVRAHVLDVREEFARDHILPALAGDALDAGGCPRPSALALPLIVKKLVEIGELEGADAIAHGCHAAADARRVETLAGALAPAARVLAPVRDFAMTGAEQAEYARSRRLAVTIDPDRRWRAGTNLWGRTIDGVQGDPKSEPPDAVFAMTNTAAGAPDLAACVELTFDRGRPAGINGITMGLVELVDSLGTIAAQHGVGRMEIVEAPQPGPATRRFCEAPAAVVLYAAREDLARFLLPPDVVRRSRELSMEYADLIDRGLWFTPRRAALDAFFGRCGEVLTGTVRAKLFKGRCTIAARWQDACT